MSSDGELVTAGPEAPHFLVHDEGDHVAVAVQDVGPGPARVRYLDSERRTEIEVVEDVPLGHKVALVDLAEGAVVLEYRTRIGIARSAIARGQLVHVHNVRSARWERSR